MSGAAAQAREAEQTERLLNLCALFLSARRPVPFSSVAGTVRGYDDGAAPEALEKRFKRDREALRGLGVRVVFVDGPDGGGYAVRRDEALLRPTEFAAHELALLGALADAASSAGSDDPFAAALRSGLRKIAAAAPGLDPGRASATTGLVREESRAAAAVAAFAAAYADGRRARFSYRGLGDARAKTREISVFALGRGPSGWTVVGYDHARGAVRSFVAARVSGAPRAVPGVRGRADAAPEGFRAEVHLAPGLRLAATRVVLRARGGAERVRALGVEPVATADLGDGYASVEARTPVDAALVGRIVAAAGEVVVLSPASLRRRVARFAAAVAARHAGEPAS
jgi:predicted DNA-binding transcriptional regulator YafY